DWSSDVCSSDLFDEVIVTTFTAGSQSTLPIWIYGQIRHGVLLPEVNVVVSFVILITVIPVIVAARLTGGGGIARGPAARQLPLPFADRVLPTPLPLNGEG